MIYTIEELRDVVELVKRKQYSELEERWLELAEEPPDEIRFYDSMTRALLKQKERDRLAELFSLMATSLLEKGRTRQALEVVRTAWKYAPDLADLRGPANEALQALYGDRPHFRQFVMAAGVDQRSDLFGALQRFEEMIHCDVGEVFEHKSYGIGAVEDIDPDAKRVSIRFPDTGLKSFTFEGVRDFLTKHEQAGFRAERVSNPEGLKERAFREGSEFLRFVLQDFPKGLDQPDLKAAMLDGVMTQQEWNRWWSANRTAIRRDPYIDWTGAPRNPMRLRNEPKTYYEQVTEEFRDEESANKRLRMIAEIAKHVAEEPPPAEFPQPLMQMLDAEFQAAAEEEPAKRLECILLARELDQRFDPIEMPAAFDEKALLQQVEDPAAAIIGLTAFELQCRAFDIYAQIDLDRAAQLAARMIPDSPPRLAGWLVEWLIGHGHTHAAALALEQVLNAPERNPNTFLSVARNYRDGKYAALPMEVVLPAVIRTLAEYLKDLQNRIDHGVKESYQLRGIQTKLKNFLAEDRYHFLVLALSELPAADARELCRLFESHSAFPDAYLRSLMHEVRTARPDLDEAAAAIRAGDIDPSALYVTKESLAQKRGELQHLRSVEIPKNSREIGEAASLGDLSENAEYEAARHRQRILFDRAGELQSDIERARPLDPKWIRTDCIWIGTRFDARNLKTDETETYTILGAWDSDPDRRILSYQTPAAQQFLRKKPGERLVVERPGTEPVEYEIESVEKAID